MEPLKILLQLGIALLKLINFVLMKVQLLLHILNLLAILALL